MYKDGGHKTIREQDGREIKIYQAVEQQTNRGQERLETNCEFPAMTKCSE